MMNPHKFLRQHFSQGQAFLREFGRPAGIIIDYLYDSFLQIQPDWNKTVFSGVINRARIESQISQGTTAEKSVATKTSPARL